MIGEALLAGTPAIVSAICGYADEVQRSGAGFVVPEPFDPRIFSQQLKAILDHLPQMKDNAKAEAIRLQSQRRRWLMVISEMIEAEQKRPNNLLGQWTPSRLPAFRRRCCNTRPTPGDAVSARRSEGRMIGSDPGAILRREFESRIFQDSDHPRLEIRCVRVRT